MNFYSDDVINNIIDNTSVENIIDKIEEFYNDVETIVCYYSHRFIKINYSLKLLQNRKNKIVLYCMDNYLIVGNCPTCMIYHRHIDKEKSEIIYFILMICTKHNFKNLGYASLMLNGFIERVKTENIKHMNTHTVKIVLSSLESAVTFYETYGFRWTRESLTDYPKLMEFEYYTEEHEYFIMEKIVNG